MSSPAPRADRLSATLRQLRKRAGLSGTEAARRAGSLTQTTISRFETGKRVPTEDAVRILCRIYGASAETRRELIAIAEDLRTGATATRTVLQRGSPSMHLVDLTTELPNVRLGIVPWTQPTNRPIIHGFQIFDERAVTLTTETSFALITDARDIADFVARFEIYADFAVYGDEAQAVFQRVAGEYRTIGPQ